MNKKNKTKKITETTKNYKKIFCLLLTLSIYFVTFALTDAQAASDPTLSTYYVAPNGSDSNDGSENSPWASFENALRNTGPGDTVYCREGTYTETVDNYNMSFRGGSEGAWWTLSSYPGETCTFDASIKFYYNVQYLRIKNLNIINGRTLKIEKPSSFDDASMAHDIEFIGNTLTGPQPNIGYLRFYGNRILVENNTIISSGGGGSLDHGIYAHIGSDYIIRGNYIENTYGHAIHVYDEGKPYKISNVLIEKNILKKSRGRSGVIIAHGSQTSIDNVTIRNNIITDNDYAGIVISGRRTDNIKIYNNTVYNNNYGNNNRGQIYITEQYGDPSNIAIKNNIIDFASSPYPAHIRLKFGTAINVTCDYNLYNPGPINNKYCTDNNGIVGNPNFVNIPNNDFHLQSGSPAIDTGLTIPSVTTDYDNNPRPMDGDNNGTAEYDIGAYEYTGTYVPPPPDTEAPSIPSGLTASAYSSTEINLNWTASTDNIGVSGYKIYRDGSQVGVSSTSSYKDTGLNPETTYTYNVSAYDAAGNESGQSNQASATTQAIPEPPATGLMGYWRLDEGIGTTAQDSSGNGNEGTINGATWTTAGKVGGALSFDGSNDYVAVQNSSTLANAEGTIAFWFKMNDLTENIIISKDTNGCSGDCGHLTMGYGYAGSVYGADKFSLRLQNDGNGFHYNLISNDNLLSLTQDSWNHAALTFGSGGMYLYINGVEHDYDASTKGMQNNSLLLNIGRNYNGGSYFNGSIDEVRIYNMTLSASEILSIYNDTGGTPPDNVSPSPPTGLTVQ